MSEVLDLSERRPSGVALWQFAEREQLFNAVVESSTDAVVTKTLDGVITGWNEAAELLFGFSAQEAIGKSIDIIVPDELRGEVRGVLDRIRRGEKVEHYETVRVSKARRRIDVSLSISPLKTPTGEIVGAAKVARDITQKKIVRRALAEASEELRRSNADLEQFAHVVAHDLQEPLRTVVSYTQLFAERHNGALDERSEKYARYILEGATRLQQIIKGLLAYARVGSQGNSLARVNSKAVVDEVLASLKTAIEEGAAEIVCGPLPVVSADRLQLGQVFQNIIANALRFHGEAPLHLHIGADRSNDAWVFRIEDNGIGIEAQYAERIFQMFQRLHPRERYPGTGIGLSIAKKIVDRHGGRIWFESMPGRGSTFYFTIPSGQGERS